MAAVQGFAPHYDDVDVFIVHTAGRKRWRVYKPLPGAALPPTPSPDFDERRDDIGAPLLDTVLEPGDLLYLPRGTVHQAEALGREPALHVTVSANQRKTWADLLAAAAQVRLAARVPAPCVAAGAQGGPAGHAAPRAPAPHVRRSRLCGGARACCPAMLPKPSSLQGLSLPSSPCCVTCVVVNDISVLLQEAVQAVRSECLWARLSTPPDLFSYLGLMHQPAGDDGNSDAGDSSMSGGSGSESDGCEAPADDALGAQKAGRNVAKRGCCASAPAAAEACGCTAAHTGTGADVQQLPLKERARAACQHMVQALAAELARRIAQEDAVDAVADAQATALLATQLPPAGLPPQPAASARQLARDAHLKCAHLCVLDARLY